MKIDIHPASTTPILTPTAYAAFQVVLEAMQDAEEIWGDSEAEDYRDLMADIARAARGEPAPGWERLAGIYQRTIAALIKGRDLDHFADYQALCARTAAEAEQRIANNIEANKPAPDATPLYRTEFPDFGELDVLLPAGFTDASNRNDMCPTFEIQTDADGELGYAGLTLYIDYADPEKRELGEVLRFGATTGDPCVSSTDFFTTSEWDEMLAWIEENRPDKPTA